MARKSLADMDNIHYNAENDTREAISVLFGPQGAITSDSLLSVRRSLQENADLGFLSSTISELPTLWPVIQAILPGLDRLQAEKKLKELDHFFRGDSSVDFLNHTNNNVLLSPLTVIVQIVDFWNLCHGVDRRSPIDSQFQDVQGFCVGFLTATAVSCSADEARFQSLASNAVRLALCIGALVDLDALKLSPSLGTVSAIAVRWRSSSQAQHLQDVMELYPDTYISVITDMKTVTVTIPERDSLSFMSDLAKQSLLSLPLATQGRWHHRTHFEGLKEVLSLCERDDRFQLPDAKALNHPLLSNMNGETVTQGALHKIALESILTNQSRWDLVFDASLGVAKGENLHYRYMTIGEKVIVPRIVNGAPSAAETFNPSTNRHEALSSPTRVDTQHVADGLDIGQPSSVPETAVAIIGMSCRYPDADSVEEFWDLINEGRCAVRKMPEDRFNLSELSREPKGPFWGGFVRRPDAFDHRFFGISGREAKSMDPQQRLCLQVAYEAMESAGYCGLRSARFDKEVGCYIGVANEDYVDNVASHPVNAFSATGTLRAFIAGRISHYFGWTGPSMTLDTACSASAVAIHTACRALQTNDCSIAVAGGVCAMTSSNMTQNLMGAGFLSPTGPSKAFDANADGYCRGEGAGLVVLRLLKDAIRHGDQVLGVITGSALNQGGNTSSITVPDPYSQYSLYTKVLAMSGTKPSDVSYIEAHGTGTQVGDPIEFKSIREVFGGAHRGEDVFVGSVKDNIGHTEASSGVAGLLKTILMMQKKTIPKQANFGRLNPKIEALGKDRVLIPTQSREWKSVNRIAIVNNYGASGNNAAMIIQEASTTSLSVPTAPVKPTHVAIFISAKMSENVRSYCNSLRTTLSRKDNQATLADVAYNLSVKQNRNMESMLALTASNMEELLSQLETAASGTTELQNPPARKSSVVLCFGGQDGLIAHISEDLYNSSVLLQRHLADCELVCTEQLRLRSLFPTIFEPEPIKDIVTLHCILFSIQYACAMSWLDSGLKVDRMIGHSFGQLTALCVAGSLSLLEAFRLVSERARLVQEHCGPTKGLMLAVEGTNMEGLLHTARQQYPGFSADVACYNGPSSFVVAGDETSVRAVEQAIETLKADFRAKRLDNSHAFHSRILDGIIPGLLQTASSLHFKVPDVPIEACSIDDDWSDITPEKIVRHSRLAVHFMDAVRRIEKQLDGPIVWLEAGSGSPIVPMIKRAIHPQSQSNRNVYVATSLRKLDAQSNLAKAVGRLWANGVRVQFWPFHESQRSSYGWVNLPPYSFSKTSHWLEYKPAMSTQEKSVPSSETLPRQLVHRIPGQSQGQVLFEIDTKHELYQLGTQGHAVVGQTLCPSSLHIEFLLTATQGLVDGGANLIPRISGLTMSSPLVLDPAGKVFLRLKDQESQSKSWDFSVFSREVHVKYADAVIHATGHITLGTADAFPTISTFQSVKNLILLRCAEIESSPTSIGFKGPTVYQAMHPAVTYSKFYQGIDSIYTLDSEAVAHVSLPSSRPMGMGVGFCDPVLTDNFNQVSGVLANCFAGNDDSEMCINGFIGDITFTQRFLEEGRKKQSWTVYCKYERVSPKKLRCDTFVFEPQSGELVLTVMSTEFQKVSTKNLAKTLTRLNGSKPALEYARVESNVFPASDETPKIDPPEVQQEKKEPSSQTSAAGAEPLSKIRKLLVDILQIPEAEILPTSMLEDLGIDSLLITEIFAEMNKEFKRKIPLSDFQAITDVQGLASLVSGSNPASNSSSTQQSTPTSSVQDEVQTLAYAEHNGTPLLADIYFPNERGDTPKRRPIALMIHGGGHVISTRKDIRLDQTQILLKAGFLPVSVDYRLCPEVTLIDGPMTDVAYALSWARKILPTLTLNRHDVQADGDNVVAVGWSTGGHLAMSLGWTATSHGTSPPQAVLAFYCPTDYEDPFWLSPNLPFGEQPISTSDSAGEFILSGVQDRPLTGYSLPSSLHALGGWMSLDDPRSRLILHMNWEGQTLPILVNGLSRKQSRIPSDLKFDCPPLRNIRLISPLAHIRSGTYKTPTFLIHGTQDDLIPWEQAQRTFNALREQGVPSKLVVLQDALHLFDMYHGFRRNQDAVEAVNCGFGFLASYVTLSSS